MKSFTSFLVFALSSLFLSPSSSAARPLSLISAIPSSAPAPIPSVIAAADNKSNNDNNVEVDVSVFTDWNILDISDPRSAFQNLPELPRLDISSLHVSPDVETICSATDYVAECIVSILPLLRENSLLRLDTVDVLRMEMNALFDKANVTLDLAKHLMVDQSTPPAVAEVLDTCVDNYESLLDDLLDASIAVDDSDFGRLESVLSATIADVVTCSDAFTDQPELESPMANVDAFLKKLCSNVLAISQMIHM